LQIGQRISSKKLSDEHAIRNEGQMASEIRGDPHNLTLAPSHSGKGDNQAGDPTLSLLRLGHGFAPPRITKMLPLGPTRTQLTSVRTNSGVQIG
jgi:hypothetical protein